MISFESGTTQEEKDAYYEFILIKYWMNHTEEETKMFRESIKRIHVTYCDGCDDKDPDIIIVGECEECGIKYDLCEQCKEEYTLIKCPNKCIKSRNKDREIFISKRYACFLLDCIKFREHNMERQK